MSLSTAFRADVAAAGLPAELPPESLVAQDVVAALPPVVQRYLRAMGALGAAAPRSFTVRFEGRFRRSATEAWMPCQALQYNVAAPLTRIFTMQVTFRKVIPMIGHDTYIAGTGRMVGKVLGLLTVADGQGEPYDLGELVTYLNDAILLAPGMLIPAAQWVGVDESSFDVTLTDSGHTVTARVFVDDDGRPVDFSTTDRFLDAPDGPVRCEWRTPIDSWDTTGRRPFPGTARATWMRSTGPLTYIEGGFVPGSVTYDVTPADAAAAIAIG